MSTALTKTTIGDKVAYKGVAFHMATSVDADGVVIIAADEAALRRVLPRLGLFLDPNMSLCQNVILTKDEEPSHG